MPFYTPEPPLEPPYDLPDCICEGCQGELYGDEMIYISDGRYLCEDCFREEIFDLSTSELADTLGVRQVTAEELNPKRQRFCII